MIQKTVKAHIESNAHGLFSVYTEEDLPFGLIGEGYSIAEAKEDFIQVYEGSRKDHKDRTGIDVALSFTFVLDASASPCKCYKDD